MNEEIKTVYTINIGTFTVDETDYPDRCLSASFGGIGVQSESIPWEGAENQPWDYVAESEIVEGEKKYTGEFTLSPIVIPVPEPEPTDIETLEAAIFELAEITSEHNAAIMELAEIIGG